MARIGEIPGLPFPSVLSVKSVVVFGFLQTVSYTR